MVYLFYLSSVLFVTAMLGSYTSILERRLISKKWFIVLIPLNFILMILLMHLPASAIRIFGTIAVYTLNVAVFYKTNLLVALNVGGIYGGTMYCLRGIIVASYSLSTGVPIEQILGDQNNYYILGIITFFATLVLLYLLRSFLFENKRVKSFYFQRSQLKFFVIYLYANLIFLVLINDGRSIEINNAWFTYVCLASSVLSEFVMILIYNHLVKLSEFIEKDVIESRIIESLEGRLEFYKALETQTLSIRKFKHDYNKIISVLNYYIENKDIEGMERYLNETNNIINKPLDYEVQYSNNTLLDAMLQNAAQKAKDVDVAFDARVSIPEDLKVSDLDLVRLFGNLMDNAILAASKVTEGYVNMVGIEKGNWFVIEIVNNFDGIVRKRDGKLITTKEDDLLHGHGLKIIAEVTERYDGVFTTKVDEDNSTFTGIVTLTK